jgi:hypothetical protein
MNIWEKSNEYENYENNINKRNKIFKYCHKHAPIEELHAITFPIMEFMDLSVYERISLRPRVPRVRIFTFGGSHISKLFFFPSEQIGKKESQSHKPLQSQDITSRHHVLQALAHLFKRQGSANSHTPRLITGPLSLEGWRSAAPIAVALAIP